MRLYIVLKALHALLMVAAGIFFLGMVVGAIVLVFAAGKDEA